MRFVDCSMNHDHDDPVLSSALSDRYEECDNNNEDSDDDDGDNNFNNPERKSFCARLA